MSLNNFKHHFEKNYDNKISSNTMLNVTITSNSSFSLIICVKYLLFHLSLSIKYLFNDTYLPAYGHPMLLSHEVAR